MMSLENELWLGIFLIVSLLVCAFLWYRLILEQKMKNEYRLISRMEAAFIRKAIIAETENSQLITLSRVARSLDDDSADKKTEDLEAIRKVRKRLQEMWRMP